MDQNSKEKTLDKLTRAETINIVVSANSGFDGLASGLALYLSCAKLGKNVSIVATEPSVGDAKQLYGVDQIGRRDGNQNLVVVVDDAVENVDKITYYLDGNKLKIVVHPFPGSRGISQNAITFENSPAKPDAIFALGYTSEEELRQEVVREQNIDPNVWLINITRKDMGQIFAQVNVFNEQATSLSEVTAKLIQDLALPLDEDIAYNLYHGIAQASDNFSPNLATETSLEIAAWLIKFGAGRAGLAGPQIQPKSIPPQPFIPPPSSRRQGFTTPAPYRKPPPGPFAGRFPVPPRFTPPQPTYSDEIAQTPIEEVERVTAQDDWLKPPKIYKGSKSFDKEG